MNNDQEVVTAYFEFLSELLTLDPEDPSTLGNMKHRFKERFGLEDDIRFDRDRMGSHLVYPTPLTVRGVRIVKLFETELHAMLRAACKKGEGENADHRG